jgi:hypothetical protein
MNVRYKSTRVHCFEAIVIFRVPAIVLNDWAFAAEKTADARNSLQTFAFVRK